MALYLVSILCVCFSFFILFFLFRHISVLHKSLYMSTAKMCLSIDVYYTLPMSFNEFEAFFLPGLHHSQLLLASRVTNLQVFSNLYHVSAIFAICTLFLQTDAFNLLPNSLGLSSEKKHILQTVPADCMCVCVYVCFFCFFNFILIN